MFAQISRIVSPPLIILIALAIYRVAFVSPQTTGFTIEKNEPWTIAPRFDLPRMVTDEQLSQVLDRMKPSANPPNTNNYLHALRLWGPRAEFDAADVVSGQQMLRYFLDDREFQKIVGADVPPLFEITPEGPKVRDWVAGQPNLTTSSYHRDDVLATFAESGAPLDTPIITRNGETTIGDLLHDRLMNFHLDRHEFEWSMISYARYLYPMKKWRNTYGDEIDLNDLVDEIISHPLQHGPCNGTHRLEAMVVLYRAREHAEETGEAGKGLSARTQKRMFSHMGWVSTLLGRAQTSEGYWTRKWPEGAAAKDDTSAPMSDRILVTGHHLEWLALAPAEVQPPRETLVRAAQWLVRAMLEEDPESIQRSYGPYSHAARALCLWRSKNPYRAWLAGQELLPKDELRDPAEAEPKDQVEEAIEVGKPANVESKTEDPDPSQTTDENGDVAENEEIPE